MMFLENGSTSVSTTSFQSNSSVQYSVWNESNFPYDNNSDTYVPYVKRPETYIVPVIFLLVFLLGLIGNGTLIFIFFRNRSMRSIPNIYIISLAAGDFIVIIGTVPFISTIYTFDSWPYGETVCKMSEFLRDVSIGVTVLTLTSLSADRYFAIVTPLQKHTGKHAKAFTVILSIVIWVISMALAIPGAFYSFLLEVNVSSTTVIYVCYPFPTEMWPWYPQTMVLTKFLLLYAIPLMLISSFYIMMARHLFLTTRNLIGNNETHKKKMKARTKVAKIVLAFVVIFAFCFFPSHMFLLWYYFNPNSNYDYNTFWHAWKIMGYILTFVNSCLNPIVLYFISGVFRNQYRRYLCCYKLSYSRDNSMTFRALNSTSNRSTVRTTTVSRI